MGIGSRVEKIRIERGLSRKQLAREIGEPVYVLRALEYGSTPKNVVIFLPRLADALGVSLDTLFGVNKCRPAPLRTARELESLVKRLLVELDIKS